MEKPRQQKKMEKDPRATDQALGPPSGGGLVMSGWMAGFSEVGSLGMSWGGVDCMLSVSCFCDMSDLLDLLWGSEVFSMVVVGIRLVWFEGLGAGRMGKIKMKRRRMEQIEHLGEYTKMSKEFKESKIDMLNRCGLSMRVSR